MSRPVWVTAATDTTMRILVTGAGGQVGGALLRTARSTRFTLLPADRAVLDLADHPSIRSRLDRAAPDIVVNCAAYTAVDQAESEPDRAFAVNARGPGVVAEWCRDHDRALLHLSTDYVFDGTASRPYREDDPINPQNVYGASKAEGEAEVRRACPRHVILRTAWVYAADGKNFVRTMLRLGAARDALDIVADQRGCPTAAGNIANAILAVLARLADDSTISGTYHYVDSGETTWFDFADRIFAGAAPYWGRRPAVRPITTAQSPTPARRPGYSVLDTGKFQASFAVVPPPWQASLDQVVTEVLAGAANAP